MSCRSLCNVLQCLGDETPLCDFAIQLCVSTIYWTVHITYSKINTVRMKNLHVYMGTVIQKTVLMPLKCFS